MPKRPFKILTGIYYHIFSRGNNKNPIFSGAEDYRRFLDKVGGYCRLYPIEIHSFCLLLNHFHFIVRQTSEEYPISRFFGSLLSSHSQYMNKRYGMVGHLMQSRFQAKPLENEFSFLQASRYIHINPIKDEILKPNFIRRGDFKRIESNLKKELENYPWSSYQYFLRNTVLQPKFLITSDVLELSGGKKGYKTFVESKITIEDIKEIETLNKP